MDNQKEHKHEGGSRLEKKPKKSRLTRQQKILLAVVVILAIALAVVAACQSLFVRPDIGGKQTGGLDGDGSEAAEEIDYGEGVRPRADGERKSEDFYTVLILGRDTGGGGNTDTMLLASYDVTNQKATVMSIPRDTMVNVSWDVKKINSVYNTYGGGEKGIQAVYKEISQLMGFEPDYQVVVEWEAVGKLVDAIGGVYFDVPYDMHYNDPYQDLVINQAKGYRLLNGDDAMQVIRWRKNNGSSGVGDVGRMEIQQDFLKAVIKQMLTIKNIGNINKIAKVFQESVETDMSFQNILWFAQKAILGGLSVDNVEFVTMPYKGASAWSRSYHQNLSYVVPIASELLDIVNNRLSPFVETFTLSDLDIMSVNSDGSLRSTTGRVEDSKAAVPPVKPSTPVTTEPVDDPIVEDPVIDENGNTIGSEGGESAGSPDGGTAGTVTPPESGETTLPAEEPQPETPSEGSEPQTDTPEEPAAPADTTVPEDSGFSMIEPPPAA